MNKLIIKLRTIGRQTGLIPIFKRFLPRRDYEEKFSQELLGAIRPGDTVWDIGANVGYYTTQFAQVSGVKGKVFAFEPAPGCLAKLRTALSSVPAESASIGIVEAAVSDKPGKLYFSLEEDPTGVTHQLVSENHYSDRDCIEVSVISGDSFAKEGNIPNIIKIDVEGFEEEVLKGMKELLNNPALRAVFCEIHFSQLAQRGEAEAPVRIESLLKDAGFSVSWPSHSHIAARRIQSK